MTVQSFRVFIMEEYLESIRLERLNMAESGARSVTIGELLLGVGLDRETIARTFLDMSLANSPNWGRDDLRDLVARLHPGARRENVLITTGTSEALYLLLTELAPRKLALAMPAFQALYDVPARLGAEIVPLPIRWDERGQPSVDAAQWLSLIERTRPDVVLLNTPHNPSGLVFDPKLVQAILELSERIGFRIVADEHYRFHAEDDRVLGDTLYRPNDRVFVVGSFIKCLGCTGLRIGWCVGPNDVLSRVQNAKNYTTHTVIPVSEWIAYEVLRDLHSPILARMREEWKLNRRLLSEFLASSDTFSGVAPRGGFVTVIGVRKARDRDDFERVRASLADKKVFPLPIDQMELSNADGGSPIERGFGFRLGVGLLPEDFREALSRMSAVEKNQRD